jgi:hypothetical protein
MPPRGGDSFWGFHFSSPTSLVGTHPNISRCDVKGSQVDSESKPIRNFRACLIGEKGDFEAHCQP